MLDHMNADHLVAIRHYCDTFKIDYEMSSDPVMIGIDSEGIHLRVGSRIHRINFTESVTTATEVRKTLVAMAKV